MYVWKCPKCGKEIFFPTLAALFLAAKCGGCQGCRAKATFEAHPHLLPMFTEFWSRTGTFPVSPSWTTSVPISA